MSKHDRIPVLYGPTASGKSAAALDLAAQCNGVIINADAMQCYRDLPILTAQPSAAEQGDISHKLYGVIDGAHDIIVTEWCALAHAEIRTALRAGQQPILVGGTGFYIQALRVGLSPLPTIEPDIRRRGNEILRGDDGLDILTADLQSYSAAACEGIEMQNPRRVLRAWEVLRQTGKSWQEWQELPRVKIADDLEFDIQLVTRPRDELIARIARRFDQMLAGGVLDEVAALSERIDSGDVSMENLLVKAHGFRALRDHLQGRAALVEASERAKIETRQYAKRQMTWARAQFQIQTA